MHLAHSKIILLSYLEMKQTLNIYIKAGALSHCTNHKRPNLISDIYTGESFSLAELNKSQGE